MKKIIGLVVGLLFSMVVCFPAFSDEVLKKQMIAGKEYKVETITEEPGKYWIYWGEEKTKWEPRVYTQDCVKKEGPLFYDRFIEPGLPYPWEIPLEERGKWDAFTVADRSTNMSFGWPFVEDMCGPNMDSVIDPRGQERVKKFFSWARGYFLPENVKLLPKDLQGKIIRKYMLTIFYPDDVKGMSLLVITYRDPEKPDDIYFYLPSMRKAKRMPEGSRQDYVPGALYRQEDFAIVKPIHKYKILRTELFKHPGMDVYGFREKAWEEKNLPVFRNEGEPCWVMEATPKRQPWWFAKQIWWVGMKSVAKAHELSYDAKGRLIRTNACGYCIPPDSPQPYYATWNAWTVEELNTGYHGFGFHTAKEPKTPYGEFGWYWNTKIPELVFTEATQRREPTSTILFWR